MNCNRVLEALDALADGELGRWQARRMERHLERCAACSAAWTETQRLGEQARAWRDVNAPEALQARIAAAVASAPPSLAETTSHGRRPSPARIKENLRMNTTRWGWMMTLAAVLAALWIGSQRGGDVLAAAIRATEAAPAIHGVARGSLGLESEVWIVAGRGAFFRDTSDAQTMIQVDDMKRTYTYRETENQVTITPTKLGDPARASGVGGMFTLTGALRDLTSEHKPEAIQVDRVLKEGRHLLRVTAKGDSSTIYLDPQTERVVLIEDSVPNYARKMERIRATVEYPDPATVNPLLFQFKIPLGATVVDQSSATARQMPQRRSAEEQCGWNLLQLRKALLAYVTDHKGQWPRALRPDLELYVKDDSVFYCPLDRAAKGKATSYQYYRPAAPVDPAELTDRWNAIKNGSPEDMKRSGLLIECRFHTGWTKGLYLDGAVLGSLRKLPARAR